ncbi:MAG: adenylate/guanylate cyclase domain-containing protein [bacterium]
MKLLQDLSFNETRDLDFALKIADKLVTLAKENKNNIYLYEGYMQKGNSYLFSGDYNLALQNYFNSSEIAIKSNLSKGKEGSSYLAVADIYSEIGNNSNAKTYYNKAISTLRESDDKVLLATALLNAGDEYLNTKNYDDALSFFRESGFLFKESNYPIGSAYSTGNIGMVYAEKGKDDLAEININNAITVLEEYEDYYSISEYLTYMSDIYAKRNEQKIALSYAYRSLELASKYGLKKQISETNLLLSKLHELLGDYKASNNHYKDYIIFRDSIINLENIEKMADIRTEAEVGRKQAEVDLLNQQKRNQLIIIGFTSLLLLTLLWFYRSISKEKKRSEHLLLNILPKETAQELKSRGKVKAKKFDSTTVLFSDFKGFTSYAESLSPEVLVQTVDYYFSKFDEIIERHGLEKIKTIGDAYMCAGGLNDDHTDHAQKMVSAAFDMAEFVKESKNYDNKSKTPFDIRIGINTGPVVAGVVGTKKFAYDIWGDAVNVASRMESNSVPGKINISENTFELIKDKFICEYRGELKVKNRGTMKMYFVNQKKEQTLNI